MSDIKQGDYVRITIEGPWVGDDTTEGEQFDGATQEYVNEPTDRVFLTKIEPPVEVFKPGDVVRSRAHVNPPGNLYALTDRGFVRLSGWGYMPYANGVEVPFCHDGVFNSGDYEKVDIG